MNTLGTRLELHATVAAGSFRMARLNDLDFDHVYGQFGIVTAITVTGKGTHFNEHQTSLMKGIDVGNTPLADAITLPADKAARLIEAFGKLTPGHALECHDFVSEVVGWGDDKGMGPCYRLQDIQDETEIKDGEAYGVWINRSKTCKPSYVRTHSCIGTESGRFLGVVGKSLALTIMDLETTVNMYCKGRPAAIAQTIPKS